MGAHFYRESFWIEDNVSLNTKYYPYPYSMCLWLWFRFRFFFILSLLRLVQLKSLLLHNDDEQGIIMTIKRRRREKSFLSLFFFLFCSFIVVFREGRNEKFISQSMLLLFFSFQFHLLQCFFLSVQCVWCLYCSCGTIE